MNRTSWMIGLIAGAVACSDSSPTETDGTSSGTSSSTATTTMATTTSSPTTESTTPTTESTTIDASSETTDDSTTSPADSSSGAPVCDAASSRCVAEVPSDWSGPVAIRNTLVTEAEPGCAGIYDTHISDTFANLQAGSAHTCDCSCGPPEDVECSDVTLIGDNNNNCGSPLGSTTVGDSCMAMPQALRIGATNYWRATSTVESGSCEPMPDADIDPVAFEYRLTLCAGEPETGECAAGETCWPQPDGDTDGRICVWQAGDHQCPTEAWTQRTLTHREIEDDRGCTACLCGDLDGECDGAVTLLSTNNCMAGGFALGTIGVGSGCSQGALATTVLGAQLSGQLVPFETECTPSKPAAIGSAVAADPLTLCCLPPV